MGGVIALCLTACSLFARAEEEANSVIPATTKSKPNAVGDVVLSDGTAVASANVSKMSDAQKEKAIAVIFYASTDASSDLGVKVLGVGRYNSLDDTITTMAWAKWGASGYDVLVEPIIAEWVNGYDYTGDKDGSDNYAALKQFLADSDYLTDDTGTSGNYPAFEWAAAYAENHGLTGDWANGWYLPSYAELIAVFKDRAVINSALTAIGSKGLSYLGKYWSSSQYESRNGSGAYYRNALVVSGSIPMKEDKSYYNYVLAIRAF